jgi:hypothetical protein
MTPEECAYKVVEQARITIDEWFKTETVDALRLAIAEYDQSVARRLQPFNPKPVENPCWPAGEYPYKPRPQGLGYNNCEGRCHGNKECSGVVRSYAVWGKDGTCWGRFRYCDTARRVDESEGFTLEERI